MNKKVLKRRAKFIIDPIFHYFRKANYRRHYQYARYYEKLKIRNKTILYESRDGKSITDSPYAIFKYLLHSPEYLDYHHIWSISNFEELASVISQYLGFKNVTFVKRNSKEYIKCLASCKYIINNSTFQSFFIPKKNQVYINTWHGTPLKRMGFDIPDNPAHSQNVVRNFLSADYLLSPNEHTTKMFLDSYKLNGLFHGEIIQEGYPRIDLTFHTNPGSFKAALAHLELNVDKEKNTILYAPTWKGSSVSKIKNDMVQIINDLNFLKKQVGETYNLYIKVHPYLYEQARKYHEVKDILIPDFIDSNELLSMVDILITDYSSIFFDYLVTDRPILFYVWDFNDYNQERGICLNSGELPGPILLTIQEVSEAVQHIGTIVEKYKNVYQRIKKRFTNHEDGNVTKRIVDYIFGYSNAPLHVISQVDKEKKKILIYPGGLMNNGITSSFINLIDNIDFSQYDVSVFLKAPKSKEAINNMAKIDHQARFLFRNGLEVKSLYEIYRDKFVHNRGAYSYLSQKLYPENAYKRESRRCFGNAQFDYCIDFSGYSLYWAKYLLATEAKKRICYMHNDLLSECEKIINGRKPHRINLRGLFSVYHKFDKLVSVSKGTMELNRANLTEFAEEFKFDYIMNSINPQKILGIENQRNPLDILNELNAIPEPSKEIYNFINMGRLSPEKGQDNLIRAFAHFQKGCSNSKLYILGDGPLMEQLQKLIVELKVEESVYLMGHSENPFNFMKKCDCFVLSSHYEGQPMVLLEAMTLGMNIIATDIIANRTVLENGRYGLLVDNSVEGLVKGMDQITRKELDSTLDEFIPEDYNKKAMETFYRVLEDGMTVIEP